MAVAAAKQGAPGEQAKKVPARAKEAAILVVDDDADCRTLIRDAIGRSGIPHQLLEAASGREAMDCLLRRDDWRGAPRPSLIYVDVEMPGLSGIDVVKVIRSEPDWQDIPIVMLTGLSEDQKMRQAAACGANSYVLKSGSAETFARTMNESTHYWINVHQRPSTH